MKKFNLFLVILFSLHPFYSLKGIGSTLEDEGNETLLSQPTPSVQKIQALFKAQKRMCAHKLHVLIQKTFFQDSEIRSETKSTPNNFSENTITHTITYKKSTYTFETIEYQGRYVHFFYLNGALLAQNGIRF